MFNILLQAVHSPLIFHLLLFEEEKKVPTTVNIPFVGQGLMISMICWSPFVQVSQLSPCQHIAVDRRCMKTSFFCEYTQGY